MCGPLIFHIDHLLKMLKGVSVTEARLVQCTILPGLVYEDILYTNATSLTLRSLDAVYCRALHFISSSQSLRDVLPAILVSFHSQATETLANLHLKGHTW